MSGRLNWHHNGPPDFVADLVVVMGALGLEQAVIVGHSLRTIIAQRFALDFPARTLGLERISW